MRLTKEDYVAKIVNADPLQLTIITYELALDSIETACESPEDRPAYEAAIKKAQASLKELQNALDLQYDLAKNLFKIYVYINKLLSTAYFTHDLSGLSESRELLSSLLGGWRQLAESGVSQAPLMENAQQIYAGLTYRNGALSELIVEDDKRGYKV